MWRDLLEIMRAEAAECIRLVLALGAILLAEKHPALSVMCLIVWVKMYVRSTRKIRTS